VGISVIIGATTRNSLTAPNTISMSKRLGESSTCELTLRDATGAVIPTVGAAVEIKDAGAVARFYGSLDEVEVKKLDEFVGVECRLKAVDNNHAAIRRLAGEYEWFDSTVAAIVGDIVTNSLYDDITDVSLVETGPTIANFRISYATVKEAFDALAELAGMRWFVDETNKLRFFTPGSPSAPFNVTDTTNISALSIRQTREDYCNVVVARVGSALSTPATETFVGDGSKRSFELTSPVGQTPQVLVDGVEKTVGITDVDTGKDWYWQSNSNEIRQNSGGTVLTAGNTLSVTYVGIGLIYVSVDDAAEIAARATAESNSGRYEKLIELDGIQTKSDATTAAQAYLDRHSSLTHVARLETNDYLQADVLELQPGDVITISPSGYGVTGNFLVQAITFSHMNGANDQDTYQWRAIIEAVKGPLLRRLTEILKRTAGGGSISGSSANTGIGGAGVFQYEVTLTANTTISSPFAATKGAILTVFVIQGAGPYTISFDSAFGGTPNTNISATNGAVNVFTFCGRDDSKWWQMGLPMQDIQ